MAQSPSTRPTLDVIVVATCTIDRVPDLDGKITEVPGGPGTYTIAALRELGVSHRLVTGERAVVEVIRCDDDVEYVIPALPSIPLPGRFDARAVILSPIMGEIEPLSLPPFEGLLAVDLQGFVREPSRPSRHISRQFDLTDLLRGSHVVKASSEEIMLLTPESRAALGRTLVLETQGRRGVLLHQAGQTHHVAAVSVDATNTIGAGDTFLAAFVIEMVNGRRPAAAGERAARFTESWLRRAKSHAVSL
jgi:hypothetical protein